MMSKYWPGNTPDGQSLMSCIKSTPLDKRDEEAERLIQEFISKLYELGDGQAPEHWLQTLDIVFRINALSSALPPIWRQRGRPIKWPEQVKNWWVDTIDKLKAESMRRTGVKVTDKMVVRCLINRHLKIHKPYAGRKSISDRDLRAVLKLISRWRPADKRRPKRRKSQKSPQLQPLLSDF